MSRQIKGLLYFYTIDAIRSILIFWIILLSTLSISVLIAYFIDDPEIVMYFVLSFPAYIFCGIFGFLMVKQSIPFAIKMGVTRKSLFISSGIFILLLSVMKAVLTSSLHGLSIYIQNRFSIQSVDFAHPAVMLADTWINRFIIDLACMLFIFTLLYVFGLVFYRFGLIGGGSLLSIILIAFLYSFAKGWVADYIMTQYSTLTVLYFFQIVGVAIIIYGLSWVFVRNITIVKVV
ncbi:hypothetical protein ACFFIS_10785 [Virgibacillus soli]|uniref:Uncharacterized protein n=1 Tax=Paracerasibacillus soli TaxID=480284 RepID=A0ABU5CMG9_9BACI|nr:hypothetical protein [Virgibacillus soli]MDY0407536.1 hypothetical protein [Virgibacillus soli]